MRLPVSWLLNPTDNLGLAHKVLALVCLPLAFELLFVGILLYQSHQLEREAERGRQTRELSQLLPETALVDGKVRQGFATIFSEHGPPRRSNVVELVENIQQAHTNLLQLSRKVNLNTPALAELDRMFTRQDSVALSTARDLILQRTVLTSLDDASGFQCLLDIGVSYRLATTPWISRRFG